MTAIPPVPGEGGGLGEVALVALLAAHRLYGEDGDDVYECGCGARSPKEALEEDFGELLWHEAHVARVINATHAGAHPVADAWDEGWDERDNDCSEPYSPRKSNPYRAILAAQPVPPRDGGKFRRGADDGFHVGYGQWVTHAEWIEFTSALEFGNDVTEPAATPAEMLPYVREAFDKAHEHAECERMAYEQACRDGECDHDEHQGSPRDGGSVTLAEIDRQRDLGWPDFHPEDYCHRCGHRNLSWYTRAEVWNPVMRPNGEPGEWQEIICPQCFAELAEQAGLSGTFALIPMADDAARDGGTGLSEEEREDRAAMANLLAKWSAASNAARASEHHFPADCLAEAIEVTRRTHDDLLAARRDTGAEALTGRLCSQCGERDSAMVKIGTSDGWCVTCLDEAAGSDTGAEALARFDAAIEETLTWCGPFGYPGVSAFIARRDAFLREALDGPSDQGGA